MSIAQGNATPFDPSLGEGRIGPNAIIQLREALVAREGRARTRAFFHDEGLDSWYATDGSAMVPETVPAALFEGLYRHYPTGIAGEVAEEAGRRTAAYVMANRIPRLARWILPRLPARTALPLLLKAIGKHAWTFAGSGSCRVFAPSAGTQAWRIEIARNPLHMPDCAWHRAVFQTMLDALMSQPITITHYDAKVGDEVVCCFDVEIVSEAVYASSR